MNSQDWQITNANLVLPDGLKKSAGLRISRGRIERILTQEEDESLISLNLHGLFVYPGLINSHDSLLGTYHKFEGAGAPYSNWLAWDNDLKSSALFRERMMLDATDLYSLGGYRNILSGVTSIADHIPHFVRQAAPENLPVHLLEDFGLSHSICSYSLDWGEGPGIEYARAEKLGLPYITHISEGFDRESSDSLKKLDAAGGLGAHSVLVHGLALDEKDLGRIAETGASLVVCPGSNLFIYEKSAPLEKIIEAGINLCLGTDSTMAGAGNIFQELRGLETYYYEQTGKRLDPKTLFEMVSTNPADALRLPDRGAIIENGIGDLLVLKGRHPEDPYKSLLEAELSDVFLVVRDGMPVYGSESLEVFFTELGVIFDRIKVQESPKILVKGLKNLLESIRQATGRADFEFLPIS